MRFTVIWEDDAIADLAKAWLVADENLRRHITSSNAFIDKTLANNAHQKGMLISDEIGYRLVIAPPTVGLPIVSVACQVIPDDRLVRVVQYKLTIPVTG